MRKDAWSPEENAATVTAYLDMLEQELADQSYSKANHRRRLQERFGRRESAYEFKFANISSVLRDLHCVYIKGYKPRGNRQHSLEHEVRQQLMRRDGFIDLMERAVDHPAIERPDLEWEVISPPDDLVLRVPGAGQHGVFVDFVAREANNRSLGRAGEKAMLRREQSRLIEAGRPDLAAEVVHVSQTEGDGLGYDIRSWTEDERPRLIEVKTTRQPQSWPMIVTRNEVSVSEDHSDDYVLARLYNFSEKRIGIYELPGPIERTCILEPTTFEALPRPS